MQKVLMRKISDEEIYLVTKDFPEYFGIDILSEILNSFDHFSYKTIRRRLDEHLIKANKLNNLYYFKKSEIIESIQSQLTKKFRGHIYKSKFLNFSNIIASNKELFKRDLSDAGIRRHISQLAFKYFGDITFKSVFFDCSGVYPSNLKEAIETNQIRTFKIDNNVTLYSTKDFIKLLYKRYFKRIKDGSIFYSNRTHFKN